MVDRKLLKEMMVERKAIEDESIAFNAKCADFNLRLRKCFDLKDGVELKESDIIGELLKDD